MRDLHSTCFLTAASADAVRKSFRREVHRLALLAVTLSMIGCGSGEDLPETAPVTGIVTFDGKPVEGATVMFFPKDAAASNPGAAYTDKEGKYSLTTFEKDDGALLGTHEITVQLFDAMGEVKQVPGKYGDVKTSGLTATIKEDENSVPLELTSKGK